MEKEFNFTERVVYNHSIKIAAESEELLNKIECNLEASLDLREVEDKEFLFSTIKKMGGKYTFVEDGSPDVDYE